MKLQCKVALNLNSPKEFIEDYFDKGTPATYIGEEYQCPSNRNRSIGDIYALVKNYFNDITEEEVIKILVDLVINKDLRCLFCTGINKLVFFTVNMQSHYWSYYYRVDSFFKENVIGEDGYSWEKLMEIYKL